MFIKYLNFSTNLKKLLFLYNDYMKKIYYISFCFIGITVTEHLNYNSTTALYLNLLFFSLLLRLCFPLICSEIIFSHFVSENRRINHNLEINLLCRTGWPRIKGQRQDEKEKEEM